jgi:UDP-3-O-[3-hydroxymyristoyl] glucosamine N-acyltransferase
VRFTLAELASRVGAEVQGDGAAVVEGVAPLEDAGPAHLSFFANKRYRAEFEATRAGAVLVAPDEVVPRGRTVLRSANAYLAFAKISTLFHPPPAPQPGIAPQAVVHPGAKVHPTAQVMALATVGEGAEVGARTVLHPGVHIGAAARIGEDCLLYPNVVVRERCVVGDRVILQPGVVVGGDGFGFAFDPEGDGRGPRHFKVPQSGIAVVEDDVELGANTCVDRATLGETRVGRGTKADNLVQIAHNVQVGALSLLVAQVGIGGSTRLGVGVVAGGQSGIIGHLEIGDGVKLGAQAGVIGDIPAGETWMGYPARPYAIWSRSTVLLNKLPEMHKELRALRARLEKLEAGPSGPRGGADE